MSASLSSSVLWQALTFSPNVWYPPGTDWNVAYRHGGTYAFASDLLHGVVAAILISLLRMLLGLLVFRPLARLLLPQYADAVRMPALWNSAMERVFQASPKPPRAALQQLAQQFSTNAKDVAGCFRMRRLKARGIRAVRKWEESCFRLVYYAAASLLGFYVLSTKSWFYDLQECWNDYPVQPLSPDVKAYYLISLGMYLHSIVALFVEERKKDFWEMFGHHVCAVALISFSYLVHAIRIGTLVLLVHDISDPFLEMAKLCNYARFQRLCDGFFTAFAVIFAVSRMYVFPLYIVHTSIVHAYERFGAFPAWYIFNGMLVVLQLLHLYWGYLISKMVYAFVIVGKVAKDERSQTEESEADENNPAFMSQKEAALSYDAKKAQ